MNNHLTAFDYLPIGSMSDETEEFLNIGTSFFMVLERMNGFRVANSQQQEHAVLVFFILTGGTEQKVLAEVEKSSYSAELPIILVAHPGNNSLPASLEILARLQQDNRKGHISYLAAADDTEGLAQLHLYLRLFAARKRMLGARVGLVGKPSDWLVASMPDETTISTVWGPTVVEVDFDNYFDRVLHADSSKNLEPISRFISSAISINGPLQADFKKSVDVYTGLQEIVAEQRLDALSVRCFDLVTRHKSTGCFALAQLNDENIVSGCEGDLVSTIGMLWAKHLLGLTSWMANPARIDKQKNILWLAHCTIATSMTNGYELLSHFETDLGIGIRGQVAPQPCTIFRVGGKRLNRLWVVEGNIQQSGESSNLCRTQLEILLSDKEAIPQLLENPLGNHVILVFGHHKEILIQFHDLFISESD